MRALVCESWRDFDALELKSVPPPRMRAQVLARAAATPQVSAVDRLRSAVSPVTRWRRLAAAAAAFGVLGLGAAATSYVARVPSRLDQWGR